MKTTLPMHTRKITARETLAWIVLTVAVLLMAASFTFAQDSEKKTSGKIHIRIDKDNNGKKTSIDTTFDAKDMEKAQEFMNSLEDMPKPPRPPAAPGTHYSYRYRNLPDEADSEQFHSEMKHLKAEMKDLEKQLREMHIEMYSDSGWTMPSMPPVPQSLDADDWKEWGEAFGHGWNGCHGMRIYSDSAGAGSRVMILNGDDDDAIEKALQDGGDGSKIIIIERHDHKDKKDKPGSERKTKDEKTEKANGDKLDAHLDAFPNPGNGRFTLSFRLDKKGDTRIRIFDPAGKEVYSETLDDFSGEYSNSIDLSGKGKGTYLLKITQDGKSLVRKVVVE